MGGDEKLTFKLKFTAENFCWTNISPNPATLALQKYSIFAHVVYKGLHRLKYSSTQDKKLVGSINILLMRAGGKKGENFLQMKISSYMVDNKLLGMAELELI